MMRRWRDGASRPPARRLQGCGYQIIREVAAYDIAFLVVGQFLIERGSQSLGQPAMNLPFDNHRIDDRATVVHGNKAADMHFTRAAINVYDADVAAEGIGQFGRIVVVDSLQTRLQEGRTIGVSCEGQFLDSFALTR